jgi:hypothetical protein
MKKLSISLSYTVDGEVVQNDDVDMTFDGTMDVAAVENAMGIVVGSTLRAIAEMHGEESAT